MNSYETMVAIIYGSVIIFITLCSCLIAGKKIFDKISKINKNKLKRMRKNNTINPIIIKQFNEEVNFEFIKEIVGDENV